MNKLELLKLIEGLGDDDNVLETLQGIEGLAKSSELDMTKISIEDYKNILENNQIVKGYHTSLIDSAVSKGVKSFKTKTMPKYIEEEIRKRSNEGKTPEQIELEELKNTIANMQKEKVKLDLSSKYTKVLNEKSLPVEFMDFILNEDEQIIESNIDKIEKIIGMAINDGVANKLGGSNYTPPKNDPPAKKFTVEDLKNMSASEINAHWDDIER